LRIGSTKPSRDAGVNKVPTETAAVNARVCDFRDFEVAVTVGIIAAIEHAVTRKHDPTGYTMLKEMGLERLTFEAVVLRHSQAFSREAVEQAGKRLNERAGNAKE
jgi:hypothetical protein